MYDLIIIGGGPAGSAAGVYAARKKIKTLLITDGFVGQSLTSPDIQNWIGAKHISGLELARSLEEHARDQEGLEIVDDDLVVAVSKIASGFMVTSKGGRQYEAKALLVCTGSRRRHLGVPGEERLSGKGVAYCATCDAPLFKNKIVAVIGGGNAGLEAALELAAYASKVYLLERGGSLRGDLATQEKSRQMDKVSIILNVETQEILGEDLVSGLEYRDLISGAVKKIDLEGVFVEIGSVPNRDFLKGVVELNSAGEIVVDSRTQATSEVGIWAAGDVTDGRYKQNNIAVGDAIKAVLNVYEYLSGQ